MDEAKIRKYLDVIRRAANLIEMEMKTAPEELLNEIGEAPQSPSEPVVEPVNEAAKAAREKHVKDLMSIDCWPEAVPEQLVAEKTKEDQINRANMVLDWTIERPIEGLDFLDFGCGEGWVTKEVLNRGAKTSTGYDICENENWKEINEVKFTTEFSDLNQGGYDVILLYDVLDHCKDVVGVMQSVKSLLKYNGGVVYVRCHPWTSKHAIHSYKQGLNKAFVHLFLTWEEIKGLLGEGQEPMFTRQEIDPLKAYRWWFHEFNIVKEKCIKNREISDFFLVEEFKNLVIDQQQVPPERVDGFFEDMKIEFVDFLLEKQ